MQLDVRAARTTARRAWPRMLASTLTWVVLASTLTGVPTSPTTYTSTTTTTTTSTTTSTIAP